MNPYLKSGKGYVPAKAKQVIMAHRYLTGERNPWEYKHALSLCGDYSIAGLECQQRQGDDRRYYYPTAIWQFTDDGRVLYPIVTKWELNGANAMGNFEDLDLRTVMI